MPSADPVGLIILIRDSRASVLMTVIGSLISIISLNERLLDIGVLWHQVLKSAFKLNCKM